MYNRACCYTLPCLTPLPRPPTGRDGVSNVFASALWTLDASFEVAATGAVGVNLHQGAGQNL